MSAPRKKLSGAAYRKKAKAKSEQGKQFSGKMKNWLQGTTIMSAPAATSQDALQLEFISCNVDVQDEQDISSTMSKPSTSADLRTQYSSCISNEQFGGIKSEFKESESTQSNSDELQEIDMTDPGNWPDMEKITDQQRSFLSNQAELFTENHPENIEFRSTKRDGRHLTSSMWYRTMANNEKVKRSWLIYSKTKNAIFCAPCKIYQKRPTHATTSALCSTGFINWKKAIEKLYEHEASKTHRECMIKWKTRRLQIKLSQVIDQDIERVIEVEKEKWKQILHIAMDAVLYLSTNCLSFRDSHETCGDLIRDYPQPSQGIFLNLISLLAKHNSALKFQLELLQKGQVSYLSHTTQNEIIDVMAKTVRNSILNEIKEAKYYTMLVNCTPDASHTEQMSLIIRYVKRSGDVFEIKESFIDFIEVTGKSEEYVCQQIVDKLSGLDISQCRGQSYDTGANVANTYKRVQARLEETNELTVFIPCLAEPLNLIAVHATSSCLEAINLFGVIQKVYCFFFESTARWDIMKKCIKTNLKGSSQTRWSAKYVAVKGLFNNLPEVVKFLEEFKEISHVPEAKYEAVHLLHAVKDFGFILNLTIWVTILHEINRVDTEIQKEDIILARSIALMDALAEILQEMREYSMEYWTEEAKQVAEKVGVEPISPMKQIVKREYLFDEMCDYESQPVKLSDERKMIFDRIITEIKNRLDSATTLNSTFAFLNGNEMLNMSSDELQKCGAILAQKYNRDLNTAEFCQELLVFKEQAPLSFGDITNSSAFDILQQIYAHNLQDTVPNICIALRIYATLPTTPASCERSLSKLKLIKNYLRTSISQESFSNLAILAIENQIANQISYSKAIDSFAEKKALTVKL